MGAPKEEPKREAKGFGFGFDPTAPPKKPAGFGDAGGFGGSGGFGSTGAKYGSKDEDEEFARKKFGTQKAISSDQYFGRGHWGEDGGWVFSRVAGC